MQVRADLNEIAYGKWEGLTREKVDRDHHDDYVSWLADPAWHAPTGGELATAVARRSLRVIDENQSAVVRMETSWSFLTRRLSESFFAPCWESMWAVSLSAWLPGGFQLGRVEFSLEGPLLHSLADRTHLSESLRSLRGT